MKELPVVFENEFCVVFDKPAGLSVQGGEGIKTSLDSILAGMKSRPLLVHRLDRDTSGLILTAKSREAAAVFGALFSGKGEALRNKKTRLIKKYIAVSSGIPREQKGLIRLPLKIRERELEAETSFRVVSSGFLAGAPCSLLELELGSGRMHQIRRHLPAIGHPVIGDDKYGDFPLNRRLKKSSGIKRLLLHAHKLFIPAAPPFFPVDTELEAPPPECFTILRLDNGLSFFP